MDRVRWRPDLRRWVPDPAGVSEDVARRRGFIALARPYRRRWRRPRVRLVFDGLAAKARAALRAAKAAAARERQRAYFAAYYEANRSRIAERRRGRAQRRAPGPLTEAERAKAKRYRAAHPEVERARYLRHMARRRAQRSGAEKRLPVTQKRVFGSDG
jgi:hypothetical protein